MATARFADVGVVAPCPRALGVGRPDLFEAALANPFVHTLQHASFLLTALLFFGAVFSGKRPRGAPADRRCCRCLRRWCIQAHWAR
jgi:cytochrome c oxidase assembly factor CtaG